MLTESPKIYTISPMAPFLRILAKNIMEGRLIAGWPDKSSPYSLSDATIYMPTKRSADLLEIQLKSHAQCESLFLPKIISLGEIDEDGKIFSIDETIEGLFLGKGIASEISPLKRRLILTKLILTWSKKIVASLSESVARSGSAFSLSIGLSHDPNGFSVASTIDDSLALADSLGYLIDTLVIYKKTWHDVHALLPHDLSDEYWKISKDFLQIAAEAWPAYCHQEGVMDAAQRRDLVISAEAERLLDTPPAAPIIMAGSTGSMPSTAKLICSISKLPLGAIVLPGIDQYLDEESWAGLTDFDNRVVCPGHPQALLSKLIRQIGINRHDIVELSSLDHTQRRREKFLSECMRPSVSTHLWSTKDQRITPSEIVEAISGLSLIEADNEREEAIAISLALRAVLETPGKSAALITPDRSLAKRVGSELLRWGIVTNDSAGTSLHRSSLGSLAHLLVTAIVEHFSPISLLALLNHREIQLGLAEDVLRRGIAAIDICLARIPIVRQDIDGLIHTKKVFHDTDGTVRSPLPSKRLTPEDWRCAKIILEKINSIYEPFRDINAIEITSFFSELFVALKLTVTSSDNVERFKDFTGSAELADLFETIQTCADLDLTVPIHNYPAFFEQLMASQTIPDRSESHPRVKILGLLEARLLRFDLVILGGLDEKIWPPDARTDPFLNRPWRDELGLPTPERRIGQTAHDLISALGMDEVIMTRALKRGGSPTIASRFLQRMNAVAGKSNFDEMIIRGKNILKLAKQLDEAKIAISYGRPRPVPPNTLLPKRISVTEVETLRRDPYAIYARHVLKLDHLEKIGYQGGNSERGNLYHLLVARFSQKWPASLPDDALNEFMAISKEAINYYKDKITLDAFWWPRFLEAGRWYIDWEKSRRSALLAPVAVERYGALTIALPRGGEITLSGQADRIELLENGSFNIIDYKTGKIPSQMQVQSGFSPQLTLEAAMLKRNAFSGLAGKLTRNLIYVKLGSKGGGYEYPIHDIGKSLESDELVEQHFNEFIKLVDDHWNGARPFYSRPFPQFTTDYGKYDHLARFREWSLMGGDADGGDDE